MKLNNTNLSDSEIRRLIAVELTKIKPGGELGYDLFEAIIRIVPQVAVEALVVDSLDNPKKILLTWREDKHYRGWHFPGGFIRFGETFEERLRKAVSKELGVPIRRLRDTNQKHSHLSSRGHIISLIYLVELKNKKTIDGQWFSKVPPDIIKSHREFLLKTLGWK